jgi:hypothetical protein
LRPETGLLFCRDCRNEWAEANFDQRHGLSQGLDTLTGTVIASGAQDMRADVSSVVTLKCQACAAEVVIDTAHAMNQRCHWCRQVLSINNQIPNGAVPDAVLPFRLTKDDAVARIRAFADKRKFYANKRFLAEFTPENVLGVYLPYMVIDARAQAEVLGVGEIKTRQYQVGSGNTQHTVYDADVYQLGRKIDFTVDDLTVEASAELATINTRVNTNNIINSILPFDTKEAVTWNADYLVGFTSERRDANISAMQPLVGDKLLSIARAHVVSSISAYDRGVRWEQERLDVAGTRWVSMYLPVWLYSYFQRDANGGAGLLHYIAVNARTGETMGSIPLETGRLVAASLAVAGVVEVAAILALIGIFR